MVRIARDPQTTAYFERKVKEGCSKRDVVRLLKRHVAQAMYRHLPRGLTQAVGLAHPLTVALCS